jgi:ribonuclease HI
LAKRLKIYFDGGCQPNPGAMETAVVARGVSYVQRDLGHGTNNDAEWLALIHALQVAQMLECGDFIMLGDSALVVNQASGASRPKSAALRSHLETFRALAEGLPTFRVRRIGRSQNLAGIALARARAIQS